jgi:hypothetical protein
LFELSISVASSIGSTIGGAIWNSVLSSLFEKYVPGKYNYLKIVQSISYAQALPQDQYEGVVHAYDDTMRIFGIASVCIAALAFVVSIPLKGFRLEDKR